MKSEEMNQTKTNGTGTKVIVMEGEITSQKVEDIKNTLFNAIQIYDGIQIQLRNIEKLDLGIVQLLYAFRRAAETESKDFEIEMHLPNDIQESLEKSGLHEKFNQGSIY